MALLQYHAPARSTYGPPARTAGAAPSMQLSMVGADRARPTAVTRPLTPAAREALLDALRSERKLLDELVTTLRRQRAAVGTDDLQVVDDTVFATHRILATLGQARVRRRQINRVIAGVEDLPARDLDDVLGAQMDDELRTAREELQASAAVLARDVDTNRRLLRDALAGGDAQARALSGAAPAAAATSGNGLLNRTA